MRRIRVFKTESFRLATVFATLFAGFALALLGAVYWIVNDTQTSTLLGAVDADIRTIINGYRDEGISEAIEVVRQRLGSRDYAGQDLPGGYILIRDRTHGTLAGNLSSLEPELGLLRFSLPRQPPQPPITVLGRGVYIADGVYLFVGRDTGPIAATRMRLLQAFAWLAGARSVATARKSVGSMRIWVVAVYRCGTKLTNSAAASSEIVAVARMIALPRQIADRIL